MLHLSCLNPATEEALSNCRRPLQLVPHLAMQLNRFVYQGYVPAANVRKTQPQENIGDVL